MRTTIKYYLFLFVFGLNSLSGQGSPDYGSGIKVNLDEEGKKYLRVISWVQGQANYNTKAAESQQELSFQVRRARVLMYSQITPNFMVLTHFGLNSLGAGTLSPTGKGEGSQVFMHDAWAQYNFSPALSLGAGLHYFNGISRLNNASTLNLMTMDNNRASWSTLGLSDQFGRHVGIFAKGTTGKFQYQLAINDAMTNGLDMRDPVAGESAVYGGKRLLGGEASKTYAGYFQYHIFDKESDFLPYRVGSYLGTKNVMTVGAGFFAHPKGAAIADNAGNIEGENVSMFAGDIFYDAPLGSNGSAITAYATYQKNNYGEDYLYSVYGSGSMVYGHLGYLIPGDNTKMRLQPYAAFGSHAYDAVDDNENDMKIGINGYLSGHNSKITLEYENSTFGDIKTGFVNLQAMVYL